MKHIRPEEERMQAAMARYGKDGGHVHLCECDVCGLLQWSHTDLKAPPGCSVTTLESICPRCNEVARRDPEVFDWVMNAIVKTQKDLGGK